MGKTGTKLPSFCLNRIRPHVRVPIQSKLDSVSVKTGPKKADDCVEGGEVGAKPGLGNGRKIMIVVDSTIEAEGALGGGGGAVEYCIQNASCMAIAVRRKSKKLGGYLITTKRQKDFWLLA
ncbi:uncharacterized protein LOC111790014 [Cucurbita pepo subsp. pepo]|uniref:uncharacterized protein LOC111790014 n=1 Tax=Cucurbita pepo subsp. pepo TaxID=3664 RepID=UPI000C9D7216|nr:uncharacterized protein LOC111790014 [Cucurbita pepo subsp. pepo]